MEQNEIIKEEDDIFDIYPKNYDVSRGITKKNCKICMHPNREDIETQYSRTFNLSSTFKWLKSRFKDIEETNEITYQSLRRHISNHVNIQERYHEIKEYGDDIRNWQKIQLSPFNSLKTRKAILEKELVSLAAIGDALNGDEKRKHVELVRKLSETLLSYDKEIDGRLTVKEEKQKLLDYILREFQGIIQSQVDYSQANPNLQPVHVLMEMSKQFQKMVYSILENIYN